MNLVKFLLIGSLISVLSGELGKYPFGSPMAISILDILTTLTLVFFITWRVITKTKVLLPENFKWMSLFWLVGVISLVFSLRLFSPWNILLDSAYLLRLVTYSSISLVTYNLIEDKKITLEELYKLLRIVGIFFIFLGFLQLVFFPNFEFLTIFGFDPHQERLTSTFLDPNFAGVFLVFILSANLFHFFKFRNLINLCLIILTLIALILTYSRTAYLMAAIFLLGLGSPIFIGINLKKKIVVTILACTILISSLFLFPRFLTRIEGGVLVDKSASERLISWQDSLKIIKNNPLIGIGFNNYRLALERYNLIRTFSSDGGHSGAGSDSSFLLILSTTGVVGFLIYLIFWIKLLKVLKKDILNLFFLFISFLISTQFINGLFFSSLMVWYFTFIGWGLE